MKTHLLLAAVTAVLIVPAFSLDRAHFVELNKKASAQAQRRDWKGLRETLIAIGREMPAPTPTYMLRMASVETRLGNRANAISWMERYAAMGLKYDVAHDDDLKFLAIDPAFARVALEMKERAKRVQKAEAVCTLPLPDLMPEDLTFDQAAETFVVSSIQHHALYRVRLPKAGEAECTLQEIALEGQAKRWPVLAVSADPARGFLWMTACAMPGFTHFPKEDEGKAALFAVDGTTGKVMRRFDLETGGPKVRGDMSVTAEGTVYVSDSIGGDVYRVQGDLKTATLEKIAGDLFSPQTPVLAADGKRLLIADYSMGIAVVDLTQPNPSGQLAYLPHPESIAVTGLDGLYLAGDTLIGIQNGTEPERIMRFHLNPAQTEITSGEVVEQATDRLGDATHVIGLNGWFYVTANVGWNNIDDHGRRFTAPVLLRFSEPPASCRTEPSPRPNPPVRRPH